MTRRLRVGFVMNPIAGIGGPAGLKGSDDSAALGPLVESMTFDDAPCTRRAIQAFTGVALPNGVVAAAPGILGADVLKRTIGRGGPAFEVVRLGLPAKPFGSTGPHDTQVFAKALAASEIDLLVFAGGDGTAADVASVVGLDVPVLGVPAGVKMFSAVFAQAPAMVPQILGRLRPGFATREVDVLDMDEQSYRAGSFHVERHAIVRIPEDESIQVGKGGPTPSERDSLDDLVDWWRQQMEPGTLYIVGAGTTTNALKQTMGGGTPLGVDAYRGGVLVSADCSAVTLETLAAGPHDVQIVVSPTGAQGCILGRGTAQISAAVVEAVGPRRVIVVATPSKLTGVFELFIDTGDAHLDRLFPEYVRVRTDAVTEKMFRLRRGPEPTDGPLWRQT